MGDKKPCKKFGRKRQKILSGALPSRRERKVEKLFEKVTLKSPICLFKKQDSQVSIDRKSASIDRNRHRLSKKQFETSSIDRKSVSIDQNRQRLSLSNLKIFDRSKNRMDRSN